MLDRTTFSLLILFLSAYVNHAYCDRQGAANDAAKTTQGLVTDAAKKSKQFADKAEEFDKKSKDENVSEEDRQKYAKERDAALELKKIYDEQALASIRSLDANQQAAKAVGNAAKSAFQEYQTKGLAGAAKSLMSPDAKNAASSVKQAAQETMGAAKSNQIVDANQAYSDYMQNGTFKSAGGDTVAVPEGNRAAYSATSQDGFATANEMRIGNDAVSVTNSNNETFSYAGVQNGQHVWGEAGSTGLTYQGASEGNAGGFAEAQIVNLQSIAKEPGLNPAPLSSDGGETETAGVDLAQIAELEKQKKFPLGGP